MRHSIKRTHTRNQIEEHVEQFIPEARPFDMLQDPTTSFLTATTLVYAIGAGITAAAGTKLALQSILVKHVGFESCQLHNSLAMYCYLLSLPPSIRIG